MKPAEIRDMTDEELLARKTEMKRAVFNMRVQMATGQLENTAALKNTKKDLARIETIIRERNLEGTGRSESRGGR
jgi:large subunit ribosomal protein L29